MTDGSIPLQGNGFDEPKPVVPQPFQEVNDDFAADLVVGDFAATTAQAPETRRDSVPLIHFAGVDIQIGPFLRQRCSWCGTVLIDYNLDRVMVPVGQEPGGPSTWPISALIVVDGPMSTVVEHVDGDPLPPGTCADLEWISEAVDGIFDPSATL